MDKTVPAPAARLLDFIGGIEAPRGYDTLYGNKDRLYERKITTYTVDDWLRMGRSWTNAHGSSAAGRYQFMRDTLAGLKKELGLRGEQVMDANLQDRLAYHLLKRRKFEAFMKGEISLNEFACELAKEWASLPVLNNRKGAHRWVNRGQSYYAGDGLNKSLVPPERVEAVLKEVKEIPMPLPAIVGSIVLNQVAPAVIKAVTDAIQNPSVPVHSEKPTQAATQIAEKVQAQLEAIPEVQHVTNTETHWYQQRSKWAAIVAGMTPLLAIAGWEAAPAHQEAIVTGLLVVGNAVAAYLAYRAGTASKPLGA